MNSVFAKIVLLASFIGFIENTPITSAIKGKTLNLFAESQHIMKMKYDRFTYNKGFIFSLI